MIEADKKQIESNKKKVEQLQQQISTLNSSASAQGRLTTEQQEYLNKIKQLNISLTQLDAQQVKTNEEVEKSVITQRSSTSAVNTNTQAHQKNTSVIGKAAKQVLTYGTVIGLLRKAYQTTLSTIKDMDEALTGMAVVTNMTREETWEMAGTFEELARSTGLAVTEVANAATMFYQQGKSTTQVLELTEAAAKAAAIAGIDLTTSVDLLTNAMNGFQMSANDAMEVSDKFAALAAAAATDYEELAIALSKVAAQANLAGMSMDFTLGMLTAGIEVTREAPETIGTALKTIIARMRELTDYGKTLEDGMDLNRVAAALDEIGVAMTDETGMMRDLELVITEVGQKWDTLNTNQQANVAVAMAGTRQQSRFIAMMQDFDRTQQLVNLSARSYGATLAQHAKYMGGVEAATNNLTTAWQSFVSALTGSDTIVNIMNIVTRIIDMADYLLNELNLFGPVLALIGVTLLGNLSTRMLEFNIEKQLNAEKNAQYLKDQQANAQEIQNNLTKLAQQRQELGFEDQKQLKQAIKNASLDVETKKENLKAKTKAKNAKIEEKNAKKLTKEKQKQAILDDDTLDARTKQQKIQQLEMSYAAETAQIDKEISVLTQQEGQARNELKAAQDKLQPLLDHQLEVKQQEKALNQANANIMNAQLNSMGLLGTLMNGLLAPLRIIQTVMTVINGLQTVFLALKKKEGQETDKNTKKTLRAAIAEKMKAAFGMAGSAAAIPVAGWVIAGVILAALVGLMIASAVATSNQGSAAETTTEQLKEMQVELYNLRSAADNVTNLGNEFEELSKKVGKTNEELERMGEIAQEVNDVAGYTVVDTSQSPEEQLAAMRAYSEVQEQKAQGTLDDMESTIQQGVRGSIFDSDFRSDLTDKQKEQIYSIPLYNRSDNKDYLDVYAEYMRDYDESFAASVKSIAEGEIEGLENIDNTELRDAILNASVDQFENIFTASGGFDFTKFNEVFNPEMLSELDNIYSSDSVADYATYYHNLSEEQKA